MVLGGVLTSGATYVDPKNYGSPKGTVCVTCHRETSPGIYHQWIESGHGQAGVNCYDCHRAEEGDVDAFEHKELISIVVTPKDCSRCHEKEYKEFSSSHHADAVSVLNSSDILFGRAVWGVTGQWTGCDLCHGSTLKVQEKGKLSPSTWPNTGIGRINPDKSKGSCTACHTRHLFSTEQARRPEACGRCHTGSSQPQIEVYTRSKHGVMYAAYRDKMNMQNPLWRAGQDYYQAPTCATCHMSAIPPQMEIKTADERIRAALESVLSKDRELLTALLPPTEPACGFQIILDTVAGDFPQEGEMARKKATNAECLYAVSWRAFCQPAL
jgi:hydroxylamine dehydrogenase